MTAPSTKEALEASLRRYDIWLIVFGALVVIGVAGESVFGFLHWRRSGDLSTLQNAENLKLQERAANAERDAAAAKSGVARLELEAAEAKQRAAEASLELAKFKAPRKLSTEQEKRILAKLAQYPAQQFAPFSFTDREAGDLLDQIANVLLSAKWALAEPQSMLRMGKAGITTLSGVIVQFAPSRDADIGRVAKVLCDAVSAEGFPCTLTGNASLESTPTVINVIVGKKP